MTTERNRKVEASPSSPEAGLHPYDFHQGQREGAASSLRQESQGSGSKALFDAMQSTKGGIPKEFGYLLLVPHSFTDSAHKPGSSKQSPEGHNNASRGDHGIHLSDRARHHRKGDHGHHHKRHGHHHKGDSGHHSKSHRGYHGRRHEVHHKAHRKHTPKNEFPEEKKKPGLPKDNTLPKPDSGEKGKLNPNTAAPSKNGFGEALLSKLGAPVTKENLRFLDAWQKAEGGSADNPFNTTRSAPGATRFNHEGVKRYPSMEIGLDATVKSLQNGHYNGILEALRKGDSAHKTAQALARTPWGTGALVSRMV